MMDSGGSGDLEEDGQASAAKNDANKGADMKLYENSADVTNKDDGDLQGTPSSKQSHQH